MKGLAFAAVIGSLRRVLAVTVALLAISGAGYLISHKLSNPDHYHYGECPSPRGPSLLFGPRSCSPSTRAAWQIPLGIAIALGGLGAAAVVAGERPRRRAPELEAGTLPPA
jgi:peptidoglycan/LPS O-acetylase OafA/YrhL